ncbi:hypothetical protein [Janthinobacterium sp.]|uniref:hypothetical protein n=1 Tax=Janthinobacterium sp. TaxID=1871054 RepID=UPI00293D3C58|nr:hypothetical protein [Janthinobacterium sp.]
MRAPDFSLLQLRLRLALARVGPLAVCVAALLLLGAAGSAWTWRQRAVVARLEARPPVAAPPVLAAVPAPAGANLNLALFYANLGQRRYAEQEVGRLFALAAKAGLSLQQGEYKFVYDKASRVHAYQVTLPVKGAYKAIWQFALEVLRAAPFAALDEISFKRELIAESAPEARLRLTFYLGDAAPAVAP